MGIPTLNLSLKDLKEVTHEKYGKSYTLANNNVVIEGKVYKLFTFPTFETLMHNGQKVSVKTVNLSFKEVEGASVPVEKPVFSTAKAAKTRIATADDSRLDRLELALGQLLKAMPVAVK